MLELWSNIVCLVNSAVQTMFSYVVDALELVVDVFFGIINAVVDFLPNDRRTAGGVSSEILETFNYVVPMGAIAFEFMAILALWIIYRILQWAVAWGKADF